MTDINHLVHLEKLNIASGAINNNGIRNLGKLRYLNVSGNPNITNVNNFAKLETLIADNNCGIDKEGIRYATNLNSISLVDNTKIQITDITHLTKLETLNISTKKTIGLTGNIGPIGPIGPIGNIGPTGPIGNKGERGNRGVGYVDYQLMQEGEGVGVRHITPTSGMGTLHMMPEGGVGNASARQHNNIVKQHNDKIAKTIRESNDSINKLVNLRILNVSNNPHITDVNNLKKLERVYATGYYCGLTDEGVSLLANIKYLDGTDNRKITPIIDNQDQSPKSVITAGH